MLHAPNVSKPPRAPNGTAPSGLRISWLIAGLLTVFAGNEAFAQTNPPMVRLANIEVHAADLKAYRAALKEEIEASIRLEPGVRTLYAVAEKDHPTRFTILEI